MTNCSSSRTLRAVVSTSVTSDDDNQTAMSHFELNIAPAKVCATVDKKLTQGWRYEMAH